MSTKIYLAKSNRANPDHVMLVRDILSKFDVEIVEFSGGPYSHKPLLQCDMLVVLPELSDDNRGIVENEEWVNLGKGLFEQIRAFENRDCHHNGDLMIVNHYQESTKEVGIGDFDGLDILDQDDYVNYAMALFNYDNDLGRLSDILENRLDLNPSTGVSSKSRYKYLLIGTK